MDVACFVFTVGAEFLQFYSELTLNLSNGVATGSNIIATNNFYSTVRVTGSNPDSLVLAFSRLSTELSALMGFLRTHSPFENCDRLENIFSCCKSCAGITNTQYMLKMGRYNGALLYAPLTKAYEGIQVVVSGQQ